MGWSTVHLRSHPAPEGWSREELSWRRLQWRLRCREKARLGLRGQILGRGGGRGAGEPLACDSRRRPELRTERGCHRLTEAV